MANISNDKRAISAVISTVIIVAVTIAVAIAVAYRMGGLVTIFTRFEKIEAKGACVVRTGTQYKITVTYVNTGATATSIDLITVNGVPWDSMLTCGVTATINLHTTGGKDYYMSVTLP